MIPAVSQRLKLIAENSITTVSKLVRKAPVRSKIERNTNPRKKEEWNNSVKVLSQGLKKIKNKKKHKLKNWKKYI